VKKPAMPRSDVSRKNKTETMAARPTRRCDRLGAGG